MNSYEFVVLAYSSVYIKQMLTNKNKIKVLDKIKLIIYNTFVTSS